MSLIRGTLWVARILVVPLVVLTAWALTNALVDALVQQRQYVMASPMDTFRAIVDGLANGWLSTSLFNTMTKVIFAFAIAGTLGIVIGVLFGIDRSVNHLAQPFVVAGWSTPKSVLYPIFILLFGLGTNSAVAFAVAWGVFPVIMLVMSSLQGVPRTYLKLSRTLRMSSLQRFRKILAPSISLELVVGLRYCWSLSFLGMIVMEMFGSRGGMGRDLLFYLELGNMERMFAVAVTVVVVTLIVNLAFFHTETRIARHRGVPSQRAFRPGSA